MTNCQFHIMIPVRPEYDRKHRANALPMDDFKETTMKKVLALILAAMMMLSLIACDGGKQEETTNDAPAAEGEGPVEDDLMVEPGTSVEEEPAGENQPALDGETLGNKLLAEFKDQMTENPEATAQELADAMLAHEAIQFSGATMEVEPGYLTGFDDVEITGFETAVMFAPAIGTIPFVGYIFELAEDADVDAFVQTLTDNANPRWNICTMADETIVTHEGSTVFFLMCPMTLEA